MWAWYTQKLILVKSQIAMDHMCDFNAAANTETQIQKELENSPIPMQF